MPTDVGAWALFAGFVIALVAFVFWGLRQLIRGRLIQGVIYDDVRAQRDRWQDTATTALDATTEMSAHLTRLISAVEQLTATQRETLELVRRLVPGVDHRSSA